MRRCFVFCAADFYGLRELPRSGDLLIAADAGYRLCRKIGVVPHLIIGDFDSMDEPSDLPPTSHVERVPVMKDDTDTMLALKAGLSRNCTEFHLYGASGGPRVDHTLANLQGLLYLCRHQAKGYLYSNNFVWTAIENDTLDIPRTVPDGLLSIFAMTGRADGVSVNGVLYPLRNATLYPDFPLGVSNHITDGTARVSVQNGVLLLGWQLPDVVP